MSEDFRVKVGIRNNCLLEAIEAAGHKPGAKLAEASGVSYKMLNLLISMKLSPLGDDGDWRDVVRKLADFLGYLPDELFHEAHMERLEHSSVERRVNAEEMYMLLSAPNERRSDPLALLEDKERDEVVNESLDCLTERQRQVVKARMNGSTLEDCAREHGVGRERIRQIEAKAERKLRSPARHRLREMVTGKTREQRDREWEPKPKPDVEWTIHEPPKEKEEAEEE